jgi:hypothetical protein
MTKTAAQLEREITELQISITQIEDKFKLMNIDPQILNQNSETLASEWLLDNNEKLHQ